MLPNTCLTLTKQKKVDEVDDVRRVWSCLNGIGWCPGEWVGDFLLKHVVNEIDVDTRLSEPHFVVDNYV